MEGIPRRTILGVLLALALLVVVLATALVFNYRWRKQLGELSMPILTWPLPPNSGVSESLYPLSAQALGVDPHLLGRGQPLGAQRRYLPGAFFLQSFLQTCTTWHPRTKPPEPCLCPCSSLAPVTDMALVRRRCSKLRLHPLLHNSLTLSPPQQLLLWVVWIPPLRSTESPSQTAGTGPVSHCFGQNPSSLGIWTLRSWPRSRMC